MEVLYTVNFWSAFIIWFHFILKSKFKEYRLFANRITASGRQGILSAAPTLPPTWVLPWHLEIRQEEGLHRWEPHPDWAESSWPGHWLFFSLGLHCNWPARDNWQWWQGPRIVTPVTFKCQKTSVLLQKETLTPASFKGSWTPTLSKVFQGEWLTPNRVLLSLPLWCLSV